MRKYETIYILRPDIDEATAEATVQKVEQTIVENGGTIEKTDNWGLKKLAYEIQDYSEGTYVVVNFTGKVEIINALDYVYKVSDVIIRSMTVREEE